MTTAQVVATGSGLGFGWGTEEGEKYEQVQRKGGHCVVVIRVFWVCPVALMGEWVSSGVMGVRWRAAVGFCLMDQGSWGKIAC